MGKIDIHTHIGKDVLFDNMDIHKELNKETANSLLKRMDDFEVTYSVVMAQPFPTYYDPNSIHLEKMKPSGKDVFPYRLENEFILSECNGKDRLLPFLFVDPSEKLEEQVEYIKSKIKGTNRIYGIKVHPFATHSYPQSIIDSELVVLMRAYNLPIIFHSGSDVYSNPQNIIELSEAHPDIRIDMAHLCGFDRDLFKNLPDNKNLFIDISPFVSLCKSVIHKDFSVVSKNYLELDYIDIKEVLIYFVSNYREKLMWGTDTPWHNVTNTSYEMENTFLEILSFEDKKIITETNAKKFLGNL